MLKVSKKSWTICCLKTSPGDENFFYEKEDVIKRMPTFAETYLTWRKLNFPALIILSWFFAP